MLLFVSVCEEKGNGRSVIEMEKKLYVTQIVFNVNNNNNKKNTKW